PHHPRSRRSRETGRPHTHSGHGKDRGRWQRRPARPAGAQRRPGEVVHRRPTLRPLHERTDHFRAGPPGPASERGGPRSPSGHPRGHLHRPRPERRERPGNRTDRRIRGGRLMNPRTNALRSGLRRGWSEFMLSLKSPQDMWFYLFTTVLAVGYLWFNRNNVIEGTTLTYPQVTLPSILGALLVFGLYIGPLYTLAME